MGKAHGYLCQQDSRWQILVNASTSPARQRYTIAHELGHYMVKANLGFAPTNRAAYWMLEDVCQAFAADVLSPASLVEQLLADASRSPSGLLDVIPALIERTGLSLEAAARRVIEAADWPAGLLALDLGPVPRVDTASRAPASLRWIHASRPWIEAGRGKKLGPRHALWPAASAGRALGAGARAGLSLGGVTEALAERRASNLVLVAVALGPPSSPN